MAVHLQSPEPAISTTFISTSPLYTAHRHHHLSPSWPTRPWCQPTLAAATAPVPAKKSLPALASRVLTSRAPHALAEAEFAPLSLPARLQLLLPISPPLDLRDIPLSAPAFLPAPSALASLPPCAREAVPTLSALASAHAQATGATLVRGRLAVVSGTPCSRLHCDKLALRSLATLAGPGTVVAPESSLAEYALAPTWASIPYLPPEEHDLLVLRDSEAQRDLVYCREGDALFLRGSNGKKRGWEQAAVHRSPRVPGWRKRFLVQVDND